MSKTRIPGVRVYNARCAMKIEPSVKERPHADGGVVLEHRASIDLAPRAPGGERMDWDGGKIVSAVTAKELPEVLSVFLGYRAGVEYRNRQGAAKSYGVCRDGERIVVEASTGDGRGKLLVGVERADWLPISTLLFRQIQRNNGGVSADVLYRMVRDIYAR